LLWIPKLFFVEDPNELSNHELVRDRSKILDFLEVT
jgi:hypothetical protein